MATNKKGGGGIGKKDGSITEREDGRFDVRKRYIDSKGRRTSKTARVDSRKEAIKARNKFQAEIEAEREGRAKPAAAREHTFAELADLYAEKYLIPAQYAGRDLVRGMRSYKNRCSEVKALRRYFDKFQLSKITYEDLRDYHAHRLATPKAYGGGPRKVTSPNRELSRLRRMLRVAMHQRPAWITRTPFEDGDPVIATSSEEKRDRILSFDEETRLFAEARRSKSKELAFALFMALDTGMRQGEQYSLADSDLDLPGRCLWATSYKGKRGKVKRRRVPISADLAAAIEAHLSTRPPGMAKIFSVINPRTAFENLRKRAGLADLHWHDLRHTAITRMVHVFKLQPIEVMKIVGHSNWTTFYEIYVNTDAAIVRGIAEGIDRARAELAQLPAFLAAEASEPTPELILESDGVN